MGEYSEKLKAMQEKMSEAHKNYNPRRTPGADAPPDGEYSFRVTCALRETNDGLKLGLNFHYIVAEGEHEGKDFYERCGLGSIDGSEVEPVGSQIGRSHIEKLGYEWPEDNMAKLEDIAEDITATAPLISGKCRSREKDGRTNTNIRWIEVLSKGEVQSSVREQDEYTIKSLLAEQGFDASEIDLDTASARDVVKELEKAEIKFEAEKLSDEAKVLLKELDAESLIETPKSKAMSFPPVKVKPGLKKK